MTPIRVDIPLKNGAVWRRRSDGAYLLRAEPQDWLNANGITRKLLAWSDKASAHSGPGHFFEYYVYGPVTKGPDAHLYSSYSDLYGPRLGGLLFHADDLDIAVMFKLTWGGK